MGGEFTYPNMVPLVLTHSHMARWQHMNTDFGGCFPLGLCTGRPNLLGQQDLFYSDVSAPSLPNQSAWGWERGKHLGAAPTRGGGILGTDPGPKATPGLVLAEHLVELVRDLGAVELQGEGSLKLHDVLHLGTKNWVRPLSLPFGAEFWVGNSLADVTYSGRF